MITKTSKEIKIVRKILKEHKIRCRILWKEEGYGVDGFAVVKKNLIVAYGKKTRLRNGILDYSVRQSKTTILSTIFHEMGHVIDYRNGKYKFYLEGLIGNQKDFNVWKKSMLKAERSADIFGKKMLKKYFPKLKFQGYYSGNKGKRVVARTIEYVGNQLGYV